MKKVLLPLFCFIFSSFLVTAQNQVASAPQKADPTEVVFKTEQEKQNQIKQIENAIHTRLASGRTKSEIQFLYVRLENIKNAKVESYEK